MTNQINPTPPAEVERIDGFADYLPVAAKRIAPHEWAIYDASDRCLWRMEGAAFTEWVCGVLNSAADYDALKAELDSMRVVTAQRDDARLALGELDSTARAEGQHLRGEIAALQSELEAAKTERDEAFSLLGNAAIKYAQDVAPLRAEIEQLTVERDKLVEDCDAALPDEYKIMRLPLAGKIRALAAENDMFSRSLERENNLAIKHFEEIAALKLRAETAERGFDDFVAFTEQALVRKDVYEVKLHRIASLETENATLKLRAEAAEEKLAYMRDEYSEVNARGCTLCVYEDGVFIRHCKLHEVIDWWRKSAETVEEKLAGIDEADPDTMPKLLPCPLCGCGAQICGETRLFYVECVDFCCETAPYGTEAEAIAAWNRRSPHAGIEAYADNTNSILTRHILMRWDREKIERFALHLLGDEWQKRRGKNNQ